MGDGFISLLTVIFLMTATLLGEAGYMIGNLRVRENKRTASGLTPYNHAMFI
jgi:hypothetical protein